MASILLIDDNTPLRELLRLGLTRAGHTVWEAEDGKEGLKLLREHPIDVLVTDVVMPEQDGIVTLQLARKLRPELRVVVISGDAPRHAPLYLKIAGSLGAHKTLMKPFTMEKLLEAIGELVG